MEPKDALLSLRKKHKLSQDEMAGKLAITRQAISRWENGITVPNSDTLKIISKVFGVSINALLGLPRNTVCQVCGMPLDDDTYSRESDGAVNDSYCKWCYIEGEHKYHSMEDVIADVIKHSHFSKPEELRERLQKQLPNLEYWRSDYMIKFENIHKEHMPPLRFTGKRYTNSDRIDGGYGAHWREWFEKGWFKALEALPALPKGVETGYVGFMRWTEDFENSFEYWIGTFDLPTTEPPEGFECIDLPASVVGVVWIRGKESDGIYSQHCKCEQLLAQAGMEIERDFKGEGYTCCFERYHGGRFDCPDEQGRVILDYGIYVK